MKTVLSRIGVGALALVIAAGASTASRADIGAGSLYVAGATNTPTHWNIVPGVTITAEIQGVSTSEVGDPLPATIDVWVKSSHFGNTQLTATRIGLSSDYSFTYTPPTQSEGACGTTIVVYQDLGNKANNDLLDDGLQNGSASAASGFRFVTGSGESVDCPLAVQPSRWGSVKHLYD